MIQDFSEKYKDIIDKERPQHPKMSIENRAKIFAPFAALKGYEDAIDETSKVHLPPSH